MYDEFAAFLTSVLRERKETPHRLSETTGIPEHILESFLSGDTTHLPAAPYIHGYVVKLGEALQFDGEAWWQQLKRAAPAPSSGTGDRLPRNRFSRNKVPGWLLWGVPLVIALVAFGAYRFADIVGLPTVAITVPDRDGTVITESPTTLRGTATPGSRVTINGEAIPLTTDGDWSKEVTLQPNTPNDFIVEATKFLGRSRTASRRIFFDPPVVMTTTTTSTAPLGTPTSTPTETSSTPPTTIPAAAIPEPIMIEF